MEKYFLQPVIDLGIIKKKTQHTVFFQGKPQIPEIEKTILSCGCTKAKWDPVYKVLSVVYKAGEIPPQVEGNQNVTQRITVIYKTGEQEELKINAIKRH